MHGQVLAGSEARVGSSYAVSTPLPIPITYPLVFRESLGSRGELLSGLPPVLGKGPASPRATGVAGVATSVAPATVGKDAGRRPELRVMCDDVAGIAALERKSEIGEFLGTVRLQGVASVVSVVGMRSWKTGAWFGN